MSKTISSHQNRIAKQFFVLDSSNRFRRRLGEQWSMQVSKKGELPDALRAVIRGDCLDRREVLLDGIALGSSISPCSATTEEQDLWRSADAPACCPTWNCFRPYTVSSDESSERSQSFVCCRSDQLAEVLASKNKSDLFIGGIVDQSSGTITLARGDLSMVTVPLSIFNADGPCKPDFSRFEIDDYGYTLRFGEYEASAHAVLYRIDPAYRRRAESTKDSGRTRLWSFAPAPANPAATIERRFSRESHRRLSHGSSVVKPRDCKGRPWTISPKCWELHQRRSKPIEQTSRSMSAFWPRTSER